MPKLHQTHIWLLFLLASVVVIIAVVLIYRGEDNGVRSEGTLEVPVLKNPLTAGGVSYQYLDGQTVVLQEDALVVVQLWASWSPEAPTTITELEKLANEYNDTVTVLAINRGESIPLIRSFLRSIDRATTTVVVVDEDDVFYNTVEGYTMPETLFFNTNGDLVYRSQKNLSPQALRALITQYSK